MPEVKDFVKLAVDAYHGKVEKYSTEDSQKALREALVKLNGGNTKLDYKAIRDGKCNGLFTLVEEILTRTVVEGLQDDDYFTALVDFRNVSEGDQPVFEVEDSTLFVISESADGTQGVRRQRLGGSTDVTIPTSLKSVRIYEELNRVLSGRIDFNTMIDNVAESFKQKLLGDMYTLWTGATAKDFGGTTYFPTAGTYNEEELLDLISHVEAASGGQSATILCTKKAARKLIPSIMSEGTKNALNEMGYIGKFYGTPVVVTPQRHKVGSTEFVMDDDIITIVAGDQKPIKCVYEGNPLIIMGDPNTNGDLTQEYFYAEKWGMGIVLAGGNAGIGRYEMTA